MYTVNNKRCYFGLKSCFFQTSKLRIRKNCKLGKFIFYVLAYLNGPWYICWAYSIFVVNLFYPITSWLCGYYLNFQLGWLCRKWRHFHQHTNSYTISTWADCIWTFNDFNTVCNFYLTDSTCPEPSTVFAPHLCSFSDVSFWIQSMGAKGLLIRIRAIFTENSTTLHPTL